MEGSSVLKLSECYQNDFASCGRPQSEDCDALLLAEPVPEAFGFEPCTNAARSRTRRNTDFPGSVISRAGS